MLPSPRGSVPRYGYGIDRYLAAVLGREPILFLGNAAALALL